MLFLIERTVSACCSRQPVDPERHGEAERRGETDGTTCVFVGLGIIDVESIVRIAPPDT